MALVGDLANIDVEIDDEDQALMLLTSLSYDNFVETLLYGRESLTLEDVLSSLNSRELKKRTDAKDDGDGLYVRGRSDHRGNQGRGSSRSKSKGKGTYKLKCYICYSEDHLKKDCPKRNKKKSTGFVKKNTGQGSGMHSEGYDNGDLLMAVSEERFLEWIMDSGGSFHMTPRRDFLFDFKEFNGGTVLLGDNRACAIMGIGKVRVQMKDGSSFVLENVRYIPELKRNLISLGTLDREGYTVKLQNGRVKVWHKRLGHISEAGLHELEKREVLGNKGLGKLEFCKNCVLGKSTRVSFGRGQHMTEGVIDYVHADLWGPSRVESMSGCRYFLSIVNDYSRRVWVHFLRHKNKAFSKFKEWKQLVENHTEATVTAAYLINRIPSTTLKKKTPMDLWLGHPANYEMLRIFGCVAYSHVNQGKLKPRAIKCIFLGYPEGVKGYRLWRLDGVKPKIIITRDVVFNESLMYKDTLKGDGAADSGKEVEFEVELQGSKVEPTVGSYIGENPGIPSGSKVDDMAAYAFAIAEEEDTHKPITFQERLIHLKRMSGLAFLHGNLEEAFYMRQPPGFEEGTGNKVCLLKKSLYGLKQSPMQRYKRFDVYMISNGFSRNSYDSCVYSKEFAPGMYIYLLLYVDDMLIACKSKSEIEYTKGLLRKEFDMKELGPARKILGMEIVRDRGSRTLKVSQSGYV
ncbi:retrotransposon protein, putative, ty1-copia subclass [Tanacetum coccineum]